jgi:leucyl aminopeptidase
MRLLAGILLSYIIAAPAAAYDPGFDRGVDVKVAIQAALELASTAGGLLPEPPRPEPAGRVWISIEKGDVAALDGALFKRLPVAENKQVQVYDFEEDKLVELADGMNRAFARAPGFFAHSSLAAALEDLKAPQPLPVRAFTLDQAEKVKALSALPLEQAIASTIKGLAAFKNRGYRYATGIDASKWLQREWTALAEGRPFVSVEAFKHAAFPQESVILTIKGATDPESVVVIGGHIDSVAGYGDNLAPGADDNASGAAVVQEVARALLEGGYRPAKTIKFIGFAAEEAGLRGSGEIAAAFKKAGTRVEGMLNLDMVNYRGSEKEIYFVSDNTSPEQNAFLARLIDSYLGYSWGTLKCGYACSDHAPWTKSGYHASYAFESTFEQHNPHIHKATDTLDKCGGSAEHALKFARLGVAYAVELAK